MEAISRQSIPTLHSDVLEIILQFLPNFFLLHPSPIAMWRKVFEINGNDEKVLDQIIHQIVSDRFLNLKVLKGRTTLELLSEIVNSSRVKYLRTDPQLIVQILGIYHNVEEWICLFERLWGYLIGEEKSSTSISQKLSSLSLKQLLMINEFVSRSGSAIYCKLTNQSAFSQIELNFSSPFELSLLYFQDEECKFYENSFVYRYCIPRDRWNLNFSGDCL